MSRIASSIPGRIRIRDTALRQNDRLERLCALFNEHAAVWSATGNAASGSIVIHYEAADIDSERMESLVEEALDQELAQARRKLPASTRVRINRAAKVGMLGCLGASLAFAALGKKRAHVASGIAFVACLGVHLAVHRRHLLR